jgi:hypothetical protein
MLTPRETCYKLVNFREPTLQEAGSLFGDEPTWQLWLIEQISVTVKLDMMICVTVKVGMTVAQLTVAFAKCSCI